MSRPSTAPENLAARLRQASSRQLLELIPVHARELTVREARQILFNPQVTAPAIEELASIRRLSTYEFKSALARHFRTPQTVALRFISSLFWRDLLDIAADMRIAPAVRRVAEKYLVRRLGRLAVGEKMAITRRATPAVISHLRHDPSLPALRSLLENPRLTEELLLPTVTDARTLPRGLDLIARNPRWGSRYEIRIALSRNPRAPFRAIFEILSRLRRVDLLAVAEMEEHSSVVRHRARELIEMRSPREAGMREKPA